MAQTKRILLSIVLTVFLTRADPALPQAPLLGSMITHPEQISGIWESENTQPALGLNIQLTTKIFGLRTTLAGVPQYVSEVEVGLYERKGTSSLWPRRFLIANSHAVKVTSRTIKVHQAGIGADDAVNLDLIFDTFHDQWSGTAHIDNIAGRVTFSRPRPRPESVTTPLVGTWEHFSSVRLCLHVAQQSDGVMLGWSDQLQVPGLVRYASRICPPSETNETYGVMSEIDLASPSSILIQLSAFAAGGNLRTDIGRLTADRNVMSAGQASAPWHRVRGDSCAVANNPALQFPARKPRGSQ